MFKLTYLGPMIAVNVPDLTTPYTAKVLKKHNYLNIYLSGTIKKSYSFKMNFKLKFLV